MGGWKNSEKLIVWGGGWHSMVGWKSSKNLVSREGGYRS